MTSCDETLWFVVHIDDAMVYLVSFVGGLECTGLFVSTLPVAVVYSYYSQGLILRLLYSNAAFVTAVIRSTIRGSFLQMCERTLPSDLYACIRYLLHRNHNICSNLIVSFRSLDSCASLEVDCDLVIDRWCRQHRTDCLRSRNTTFPSALDVWMDVV